MNFSSMNYLSLNNDDFVSSMLDLYKISNKNGDSEVYDFLKSSPLIMDRLKSLISEDYIKGSNRISFNCFVSLYDSYFALSRLSEMLNYCDVYSNVEKKFFLNDFFKKVTYDSKFLKGMKFFSVDEQKKMSFIINNLDYILEEEYIEPYSVVLFGKKYKDILKSFKVKLDLFRSNLDINEFYSSFDDDLQFKNFSDSVMFFKKLYFQSFISGNNVLGVDIFKDFKFDDFIDLCGINYDSFYEPFKKFNSFDIYNLKVSNYEFLFSLLDSINDFFKENKSTEYFIDYLVNVLKISLDSFEKDYSILLQDFFYIKSFLSEKYYGYVDSKILSRKINLVDIYKFKYICSFYREITTKSKKIVSVILSDRDDIDNFIRISYSAKYFNKISFSKLKHDFSGNIITCADSNNKKKLAAFVDGYHKFYYERKQIDLEKSKEKDLKDKLEKVDYYVSIVRGFLDSDYNNLDMYFSKSGVDKNVFFESVTALKKLNNPVFFEYMKFSEDVQKKNDFVLLTKLLKVVNGIKNGVKLADGSVKKFDLIDYYSCINMSIPDFLRKIKGNVSERDYSLVLSYLRKFKSDEPISEKGIQILFEDKYSYQLDPDNVYVATVDDKKSVLLLLKERCIPITSATFSIMLRRYVFENYSSNFKEKNK